MDPIELSYDTMDAVPEAFRVLYSEKDGKAVLSGVNGLKTQADVNNVQEALRKERENHSEAREALKAWRAIGDDPSKIQEILDKVPELQAAAGKMDDESIQRMVEARIGQKLAPLERNNTELNKQIGELTKERNTLLQSIEHRDMSDAVRAIATEMKVTATALPDVEMVAATYLERDSVSGEFIVKADAKGVTPGSDVRGFLKEMQRLRPHWWPQSQGGGAGPGNGTLGGADNPWSKDGWNLTEQGKIIREHGMARAQEIAKAANSKIGATAPTK